VSAFPTPDTALVVPEMAAAITEAADAMDAARRSVYHLTEECDAYRAVSVARGRYALLVTTANSLSGMGPEEMGCISQWATVVYDAFNAAAEHGFTREQLLERVASWSDDTFPHDDPAFA
jgi:hypothetical protein